MKTALQVKSPHYRFSEYMTKRRWTSLWHQIDESVALGPQNVLEVGPGGGAFKALMGISGYMVETVDIDPSLSPDHIGSCLSLPLPDDSYDLACAFQILEHLPFDQSLKAFSELVRVSRRHVLISLPDCRAMLTASIDFPGFGRLHIPVPKPRLVAPAHRFDGQHYWEIGKRGYPPRRVWQSLCRSGNVKLVKQFRVPENPYHHFMLFMKGDR